MIINRTKSNIYRLEGNVIAPGLNHFNMNDKIDREAVEKMKKNPAWKELIKNGVHVLITGELDDDVKEKATVAEKKDGLTADITKMKSREAITQIKETFKIEDLEKLKEMEAAARDRASVISAIDAQIKEMKTLPKEVLDEMKERRG